MTIFNNITYRDLTSDCSKCHGLCCTLLYCFRQDGFPEDKLPGIRCRYLLDSYQCSIHQEFTQRGLVGCQRYDCIGAGPHILQLTTNPTDLLNAYPKMLQLHQIFLYLLDALDYQQDSQELQAMDAFLRQGQQATSSYEQFQNFEIDAYRQCVNQHLKKLIKQIENKYQNHTKIASNDSYKKDYMGKDLSMAFLVQKDLSHQCLQDTCFLGSDVRDVTIKGSDLSKSHFLTQMQINSMIGDEATLLPQHFYKPKHW